ncbi:MAG: tetratricopeptide repeat protein [Cyclobacteriaceae bacterium]
MRFFLLISILLFSVQQAVAQVISDAEAFSSRSERYGKAAFYFQQGTDLYQAGKYTPAIKYLDSAISLDVRRIDYYLLRAEAKESAGNHVSALVDYETVIRMDPEDPNPYFKRGLIYHRQKNYESAIEDFSFILDFENLRETRGIIFKGVQQNPGGEASFTGISTMDKMRGDVLHARALAYSSLPDSARAMSDFQGAIEENPDEPAYMVNRGVYFLQLGDTTSAKSDFIAALEVTPGYKSAIYNLSRISTTKERESLNKVLYADNEVSVVFSQRAYDKFLQGRYRESLLDYDSALFWMPKNAEDLMNRGIVKTKLKRPRSAIADFDKSINLDKTLVRNYYLIGNAFQGLKDYQQAIKYYDLYLRIAGADAQIYYNKGIAELKSGLDEQACKDLTLALKLGEKKAAKPMTSVCK